MSRIDTQTAVTTPSAQPTGNSLQELDLDVFLELMLEELQNQDPLDPMDNDEMLNTISQIREIAANDRLSETLDSVLLGQNVATATGLIGTEVEGLTDSGRRVTGAVRQVAINDGEPVLDVAVEPAAEAGDSGGDVAEGAYAYEIAWETEDGTFSVQVPVSTEDLGEDFQGSIRIDNLPETSVPKKVYRTDSSGSGELRLVGTLASGRAASFVDTVPDAGRQEEALTGARQVLRYANAVQVSLSNISRVETLN
ncbi:MAG: flagellar hook capping FlgD N-terminal domain-containing protein [Planctomycetota bacterium]